MLSYCYQFMQKNVADM